MHSVCGASGGPSNRLGNLLYLQHSFRLLWSLCLVSPLLALSSSNGYGGNSLMGNFGSGGGDGDYGSGAGGGGGGSESYRSKGPITAAVETHRSVEVKPVQMTNEPHEPQVIEVPSDDTPVVVHFKSQSSRVLVQQTHTPAQIGEPEHTSSEDEPQRVIHEVVKPVIQEIREVIQPYRRLIQQIQPVLETTHTIIAKGEPRPNVEPLSVSGGASGGASGGSRSSGQSSFGGSSGQSSYGGSGSGNYAAAASSQTTVSLKSANSKPSKSSQSPASTSSVSASHQSNGVSGRSSGKYSNAQIQQFFQQSAPSQSTYSSRRGDLRETQPTQTRMSLRPAPAGFNAYYRKPVVQAVQPMPLQPVYAYSDYHSDSYSDYQGAASSIHEEQLPAFISFVAKPTRFRARARA